MCFCGETQKRMTAFLCAGIIALSTLSGCGQKAAKPAATEGTTAVLAAQAFGEAASDAAAVAPTGQSGSKGLPSASPGAVLSSRQMKTISSDVHITNAGTVLSDQVITGDLYIDASVGDGIIRLENVAISGTLYIHGGAAIHLINVTAGNIVLQRVGSTVTLVASGATTVGVLTVKTPAVLREEKLTAGYPGFGRVTTEKDPHYLFIDVKLEGVKLDEMTLNASTKLDKGGSSIASLKNSAMLTDRKAQAAASGGNGGNGNGSNGGSGGGSSEVPGAITLGELADIANLSAGSTTTVSVAVTPDQATLTATSSNQEVAAVTVDDLSLKILGVAKGTATITIQAAHRDLTPAQRTFQVTVSDAPASESARAVYNFNFDWKFSKGVGKLNSESEVKPIGKTEVVIPATEKPYATDYVLGDTWTDVSLPHTYNDVDTFDNFMEEVGSHHGERSMYTGTAWYKKTFTVPEAYRGKKVFLEFEAARQAAKVYLNGKLLDGVCENGFIPFGYDLTNGLFYGQENQITVMVDNSFPYYAEGTTNDALSWHDSHWHPTHGGLYRNANLYVTDPLHVTLPLYSFLETQGVYVYTSGESERAATVHMEAEIQNEYATEKTFQYVTDVVDANGNTALSVTSEALTLAAGEKQIAKLSGRLENPTLWSTEYPYLYQVVSRILVDGKEVDSTTSPLGVRSFRFTNDYGLFLNENYIKLHGWGQKPTNEWAGLGAAYPDWMQDFVIKLMKDGGGNFIRWGHCAGSPAQIAQSDKYGLVVEQPGVDGEGSTVGGTYSNTAYRVRKNAFRDMLIYYRNNPSIFMWELGNQSMPDAEARALSELVATYDHHGKPADAKKINSGTYDATESSSQRLISVRRGNSVMANYVDVGITTEGSGGMETAALGKKPSVEGEYNREEARRGVWDRYTEGFESYKMDSSTYNLTTEQFAANQISNYAKINKVSHSGGANWIFSDSTSHGRVYSEVSRASGEVDAVMLEKEAYYALKVLQTAETDAYIIGHWNYAAGTKKPVYVASDAASVELFVNGVSLGKGAKSDNYLFTFKDIAYQPGTIRAVGYDAAGVQVCETEKSSHGEAAAVRLTPIEGPQGLLANGSDVLLIDAEVVDAEGNRCLNYSGNYKDGDKSGSPIHFTINDQNGCSIWRGGYNSGIEHSTNAKTLYLEAGITRVAVRTTMKPGDITVTGSIDGLTSDTITVSSEEVDNEGGLSSTPNATQDYSLSGLSDPGYGDGTKPGEEAAAKRDYQSLLIGGLSYSGTNTKLTPAVTNPAAKGEQIYTDNTTLKFGDLPISLVNSDFIRVPNSDNGYMAVDLVNFSLLNDADVYVAHDDRAPLPDWLKDSVNNSFADTEENLTLGGATYSLFVCHGEANEAFTMAGNSENATDGARGNMYIVFAKATGQQNTFLADDFETQAVNTAPAGWFIDEVDNTSIRVLELDEDDNKNKAVELLDTNTASSANLAMMSRKFLPQYGKFALEFRLNDKRMSGQNYIRFLLHQGPPSSDTTNKTGFAVETYLMKDGNLEYRANTQAVGASNTKMGKKLDANNWYTIRYEVDMDAKTFDAYVDGALVKAGMKFANDLDYADYLIIGTGASTGTDILVDDVKLEVLEDRLQTITVNGKDFTKFDADAEEITLSLPQDTDTSKAPVVEAKARDFYAAVEITQPKIFGDPAIIKTKSLDGEERTITVKFDTNAAPSGVLLDEDFEAQEVGKAPTGAEVLLSDSTLVAVEETTRNDTATKVLRIKDDNKTSPPTPNLNSNMAGVSYAIPAQSGKFSLEYKFKDENAASTDYFRILLHDGAPKVDPNDKTAFLAETYLMNGKLVYRGKGNTSNQDLAACAKNEWHTVKYMVDMKAKSYTVYLDDTLLEKSCTFVNDLTSVDHVIFASGGKYAANLLLDDLKVENLDVPAPGDTLLDDDFEEEAENALPSKWKADVPDTDTSIKVVKETDGNQAVEILDTGAASAKLYQQFAAQSGKFALEFRVNNRGGSNDQFFRILLHSGAPLDASIKTNFVIESYLHNGALVYRDTKDKNITIAALDKNAWHTVRYEVDLEAKTFDAFVDGEKKVTGGGFRNLNLTSVDYVIFASGAQSSSGSAYTANLLLDDIKVEPLDDSSKGDDDDGTLFTSDFTTDTAGSAPAQWALEGTATMAAVEAVGGNHVLHLQDPKSGSVTVSRAFDAQSGKLALEFKLMNKLSDTNFFRMILHDGAPISGKEKFLTEFYLLSSGELVYRTASAPNANVSVATLNNDIWYTIRCEADFGTKTYEIFVNGESKAADIPFRNELTSVDHVIFATGGNSYKADVLLDDIKLLSLGAASAKAASEPLDTPQTPAAPAPETPSVPEAPSGNESASTPPDASEPDGAAGEPGVIPPAAKDEASASDTAPENEQ